MFQVGVWSPSCERVYILASSFVGNGTRPWRHGYSNHHSMHPTPCFLVFHIWQREFDVFSSAPYQDDNVTRQPYVFSFKLSSIVRATGMHARAASGRSQTSSQCPNCKLLAVVFTGRAGIVRTGCDSILRRHRHLWYHAIIHALTACNSIVVACICKNLVPRSINSRAPAADILD